MSNLYPVMVPESESRNAEEGNGKRQWSGFVLSQKLVPDIDISSFKSTSPPAVSSLSQESLMIVEQSSISEFFDVSSLRHPDSSNRETSKVAIVLWRDMCTAQRMDIRLSIDSKMLAFGGNDGHLPPWKESIALFRRKLMIRPCV